MLFISRKRAKRGSMMKKGKLSKPLLLAVLAVSLLILIALEGLSFERFSPYGESVKIIITRLIPVAAFLLMIKYFGYRVFSFSFKGLMFVLPALVIAINNFPFGAYIFGDAYIEWNALAVSVLLLECLSVGIFEELCFRGLFFPIIAEWGRKKNRGAFFSVIISSLVFGCVHLVNIFTASPFYVLLQVGYSFLIGGMCTAVLLYSKNVFIAALIHGIYNFSGELIFRIGGGNTVTPLQIAVTAIPAVFALVFYIIRLKKDGEGMISALFCEKER